MSGTFQLLAHAAALGVSKGIAIPFLPDRPWPLLVLATITWIGFWFHLADAAWIPSWGKGRDWIDRIGILVRGSGLAMITVAILVTVPGIAMMLALLGLTSMMIGRTLWELACIQLGVDLHASTIDESKTASKTPTNNPMNPSGGSGVS
jgi:hypothetical protein